MFLLKYKTDTNEVLDRITTAADIEFGCESFQVQF